MWRGTVAAAGLIALLAFSPTSCSSPTASTMPCECGAAPRCGEPCTASCGCCSIYGSSCSPQGIVRANPTGTCYDVLPCSSPDRCVDAAGGPVCVESASDCDAVRSAYEA